MDRNGWGLRRRWIKKYKKLGNFSIEPWDERYYALFDADELVCVTVYKKGAMEVMKRLWEKEEKIKLHDLKPEERRCEEKYRDELEVTCERKGEGSSPEHCSEI